MRKTGTRLLAVLLAVVMVLPSVLIPGMAAEATGFTDVPEGSWYEDAVNYVSEKGYMAGVGDNKFAPNDEVTRAMFVTILARITMAETDGTVSAFTDVPENKWYTGAVSWAAENGIVNGVGDRMFAPGKSITRQDLCTILYRFVNAMDYELTVGEEKTFTDGASVSSYAAEAVRYASSVGLIAGYDDGTFRPKATATRAQMAVIIMRLARLLDGQIVKPEPMPAQSFNGAAGDDMTVSVNAPKGALPENTNMTVSRVTDEAALAAIEAKAGTKVYAAADISFSKDETEIEPSAEVEVQIVMDGLESIKNPTVVHVKDDGSLEYVAAEVVSATRGSEKALRFYSKDFSVYAVTDNQTNATLTISFYAQTRGTSGGWEIVNKQIIRANQLGTGKYPISDPGVPNITTSQAFEGWIQGTSSFNSGFTYGTDATTRTVKQINEDYQGGISGNTEIVYYAAVYDVVYVTYHDQAGAVTFAEYHKIPAGSNSVSVTITEDYPPMKSNQNFSGWVKEDDVALPGSVDGTLPTYQEGAGARKWPLDSIQNISENVDLYPYVEEGYWLSFNNNIAKNSQKLGFEDDTSAEYISPIFIPKGTTPTQPAFPSNDPRHGYTFAGWYKDADMTTAFNFNQQLTEDTTVYAKWAFATTSYRVIYWKQRATDEYTYTDEQKNYDYFDSRTVPGAATGSVVGISNSGTNNDTTKNVAQNNENNFYFRFNSSKSDKTVADGSTVRVKGDGTTVLNVYYDRKTITYNFGQLNYYQTYQMTYTHSNLYGHQYKESDWHSAGSGKTWSCKDISTGEVYQFPMALMEYVPTWHNLSNPNDSYLTMNFYVSQYTTNTIPVKYVGASLTNSSLYNVALTSGTAIKGGNWYPDETVEGFTVTGYAFLSSAPTSSTTWTPCTQASVIPVGATGTLYVAFSRNNYTLTYSSTNNVGTQTEDETIPFEKSLTSYKSHTPANSYPGYYFAGWYLDKEGTQSFDLENMPARNIIVYAKWNPKWYRIVVDYKRGNSSSVITVPGSTQKASFTVQYGSTIQTSSLMQAQRMDLDDGNDNWMLVGLYLDEACTKPFNHNMRVPFGLTEAQEVYPAGSRTGIDDITGETWSDEAYPDVRAKITLYAKWRANPEGVTGIKVRYLADHAENDKGYFDSNEKLHTVTMDEVYTDQALATAHSATVPSLPHEDTPDPDRRFLYWEVLDKNGNPTDEIVYPGGPVTIDINKAVEIKTPLPDPNGTHTNEGASTIASVAAVAPTCTGTGGNAVTQPNLSSGKADSSAHLTNLSANANPNPVTATTEYWEETSSIVPNEEYLIGIQENGNVYLIVNYSPLGNHYYVQDGPNYDSTYNDYTTYLFGYTALAVVDSNGHVTGVNDTTASGLSNCTWKFSSSTGGTITSAADSTRYLYGNLDVGTYNNSSNSIVSCYPDTTATTWIWNSTDSYLYASVTLSNYSNFIAVPVYYSESGTNVVYSYLYNGTSAFPTDGSIVHKLYRKVTVSTPTTYNVTVASGITNGTVSADKAIAAEGETVTLTVTPDTGYELENLTVTDASNNPVTVTNNQFTMPASDVTVSATFSSVATDWKVSFADENGYPIPGMDDILVPKNTANNLPESALPNPTKEDYYFLGWYQGDTACTFPMTVNSDIVLTPKYSPKYAYDYTITLRAVYGPYNPDATTHIYWYANNGTDDNNGAGERYISKYTVTEGGTTTTTTKLPINAHVDIPLPTGNPASQTVFVGDNNGTLTWEDHVFLGWARVDNGGTADYAEAQILTPDDIYLKWTGDHYEYRKPDGTFSENWTMQQVYADETTPYHDMYAVWAGFYYVYHSSDGTLEAVEFTGTKQVDETTGKTTLVPATKNLVSMVRDGYIYGGYYKSYRGAQKIDGGETTMKSRINSEVLQRSGFWDYTNGKIADGATNYIDLTDNGAVDYDATTDKIMLDGSSVRLWNKTDAYGKTETGEALAAVNGEHMTPVVGKIYYLREVPNAYLPNVALAICDEKDESGHVTNKISRVYVLSASDELLYTTTQFSLAEDKVKATVSKQFIVDYREPNQDGGYTPTTVTYTADKLRAGLSGKIGWVLSYEIPVANLKTDTGLVVKPSWTTYDGVTVYGDQFTYKITNNGTELERNK